MASPSSFLMLLIFLLFALFSFHYVHAKVIILEDGYTITTVLDGHKLHINPWSVLQRSGSSDLIVLDSVNSVFYTVQFPISQVLESDFTRFSGNGSPGYSDGDVGSAQFDKPKSFAIDLRGNVYVPDMVNRVIRKISANGVTTIAGGVSEKSSRKDGPAQNASFSDAFELTFIPGLCALLVSDRGHQLVYQINLKEEDCTLGSKSGLGAVMTWTLGLGLSCLLGLVIGIAIRHYFIPHVSSSLLDVKILYDKGLTLYLTELCRQKGSSPCRFIATWKHCLTSLQKLVLILYSGIKSAVASCSCSSIYTILLSVWRLSLSHLLLMFRVIIVSPRPHVESVSLLDLDAYNNGEVTKSSKYFDQLKDLMSFDEEDLTMATFNQGNDTIGMRDVCHGVDVMMQPSMGFVEAPKDNILHQESSVCNLGIVKRR